MESDEKNYKHSIALLEVFVPYKPIRKDLTETTRKCDFCPNNLTSLKAYVLQDSVTGRTVYAGPTCAKNNISADESLSSVPDLTKFTSSSQTREGGGGSSAGGEPGDDSEKKAIEYLMLREDKLANELGCSYSVLAKYYQQQKIQQLSKSDIEHINNIEAKAPDTLRLSNLQRLYSYLFWIDVGINKLSTEKTQFLKCVRATLVAKKSITDKQKEAINKWLKNIDGVPQLK